MRAGLTARRRRVVGGLGGSDRCQLVDRRVRARGRACFPDFEQSSPKQVGGRILGLVRRLRKVVRDKRAEEPGSSSRGRCALCVGRLIHEALGLVSPASPLGEDEGQEGGANFPPPAIAEKMTPPMSRGRRLQVARALRRAQSPLSSRCSSSLPSAGSRGTDGFTATTPNRHSGHMVHSGNGYPIVVTEDQIVLNEEVSYDYVLDESAKTIEFTFSYLAGSGHSRCSLDRQALAIMDGQFGWWDTIGEDIAWLPGALLDAAGG